MHKCECIYIHTWLNVCGFSHLPAYIHLSVAKCAEMASPKNFSMGIRWAFARILCTAHMHTYTHTRTNTKGMRLGLGLFWAWTRAGPGLGFFSPLPAIASTSSSLPELEFLLYDQFRRNVSSAVAAARFVDVFATHLNLDFTEFNFAVRMTPYLCACACVCEFRFCFFYVMYAISCCLLFVWVLCAQRG